MNELMPKTHIALRYMFLLTLICLIKACVFFHCNFFWKAYFKNSYIEKKLNILRRWSWHSDYRGPGIFWEVGGQSHFFRVIRMEKAYHGIFYYLKSFQDKSKPKTGIKLEDIYLVPPKIAKGFNA